MKIFDMFKAKGMKRNWLISSLLVVTIIVVFGIITFSISVSDSYYSSAKSGLENKAKTATDFFANFVTRTYAEYYESAYRYTESFEDANKIELQFISTSGQIEISTYGMTAGTSPRTPDIEQALATGQIKTWQGKSPDTKEEIIAVSAPLLYSNNEIIGVMRYVTSATLINKQIMKLTLIACAIGLFIIFMTIVVTLIVVKSVAEPVGEITVVARRIAAGGYGVQIDKKYKDEMGEMVNAINEMSVKISQYEKTQTDFISSVSHELRTPLTAITGWGETLIYDENLDDEARRGIGIILKEARRLTKMVEELLEFTRMQDGRFTLNVQQIDIVAELEESIFAYGELLKQDDITLEYNPPVDEIPFISGDPERLRQVFLNVLDNAAKYGREGKKIVVSITADSSYVTISIRDFGPGVPEDELDKVKMKFYKGRSKERGSGIGLAVCEEIVNLHEGALELQNAQGGGLVVYIRLPINTTPQG